MQHYPGPTVRPDLRGAAPVSGRLGKSTTIDLRPDLLTSDGQVVARIHPKEERDLTLHSLELNDRRQYGSTRLLFYGRRRATIGADSAPVAIAEGS